MPEVTVATPPGEETRAHPSPLAAPTPIALPESNEYALSPEAIADFTSRMGRLVTEDDAPVNLFTAKQQRLLVDSLYVSWSHPQFGKRFLAEANVGVYYRLEPGAVVVPDCFLSVDVVPFADLWSKPGRSYMV